MLYCMMLSKIGHMWQKLQPSPNIFAKGRFWIFLEMAKWHHLASTLQYRFYLGRGEVRVTNVGNKLSTLSPVPAL